MQETELVYSEILKKFSKIPIEEDDSTFLELCHYPGERFEEICSRILEFFFQPKNKHGLRDLWVQALCVLLKCECDDAFEMRTRTEEYTSESDQSNKRIDIILQTPTLLIAIENKIGADLYNPLDAYKEHLENKEEYKTLKRQLVVLTAHMMGGDELSKAQRYGFVVLRYDQLFKEVRTRLGEYISKCDQKYLAFMMDFMKTVENRVNMMKQTDMDKFFVKNRKEIESLLEQYNAWNERMFEQQKAAIADLLPKIQARSGDVWGVYQGWDLWIDFHRDTPYRIGIESEFKDSGDNPIGIFKIYITTWSLRCWPPYRDAVLKKYPEDANHLLDEGKLNKLNRMYYHMPEILRSNFPDDGSYFDEILARLNEYNTFMKELAATIVPNQE